MMVEEWRPIEGFEDSYEVSNLGRVRSLARTLTMLGNGGTVYSRSHPEKILALHKHSNGYLSVHLYPGNRTTLVNRLVCRAFKGPPPTPEHHADHENDVRDDNSASNLNWLSPEANRAKRKVARGECASKSSLTDATVCRIRAVAGTMSDAKLAAQFGLTRETVRDIRVRKTWTHIPEGIFA